MNDLQTLIKRYLEYCKQQKRLDSKTLKAYRIDLRQFSEQISVMDISDISASILENYVAKLHQKSLTVGLRIQWFGSYEP